MSFTGQFKYQKSVNYEAYLKLLRLGWFKRKRRIYFLRPPKIVVSAGSEPGSYVISEDNLEDKVIVLGEEHVEVLPNGDKVRAVTVQEGDNCLITRLIKPSEAGIEFRTEFTTLGMMQQVKHLDSDLEATRFFKRC